MSIGFSSSYSSFSKIFQLNPVRAIYHSDFPLNCLCNFTTIFNRTDDEKFSCYQCRSSPSVDETNLPNKALLSFIILLGTCFIAVALKRFRRSNFFGRTVSRKENVDWRKNEKDFHLDSTNIE